MLDYKKTEDMERMKAEAVKRLKWPKIPGLNEAFAKGIVMVSDGTNGDVKLRNLTIYEKYMVTNLKKFNMPLYIIRFLQKQSLVKCYPCCLLENMKMSGLWMRKILKNLIHRYM